MYKKLCNIINFYFLLKWNKIINCYLFISFFLNFILYYKNFYLNIYFKILKINLKLKRRFIEGYETNLQSSKVLVWHSKIRQKKLTFIHNFLYLKNKFIKFK